MEADLSDLCESSFLLSLDLLETLDLFSDTRASESLVCCQREDVSDLACCKDPLLPVMPGSTLAYKMGELDVSKLLPEAYFFLLSEL